MSQREERARQAISGTVARLSPKERLRDLATFAREQLACEDVDPLYPVLRAFYRRAGWGVERRLWFTLLYVAWYCVTSAAAAFAESPEPGLFHLMRPATLKLPTGIERRGFRDPAKLRMHLAELARLHATRGGFEAWLAEGFNRDPRANWRTIQDTLRGAWGNGRWAAYKTGELLQKVHDWPLTPTDMGLSASSGPRWGLALLYGPETLNGDDPATIARMDALAEDLRQRIAGEYGVELGIEQLETMLCDYHALADGRYYIGHDIDQMYDQLQRAEALGVPAALLAPLWQARRDALPAAYLGELGGWGGVEPDRRRRYRETRELVTRWARATYP